MAIFFAFAVFIGSALLLCLQPMLGRALLPIFGGSSHIWTVCLVVYQSLLLAGAIYANGISRLDKLKQRMLHLPLLFLSFLWIIGVAIYKGELPNFAIGASSTLQECCNAVLLILFSVGLPYIVLGAGSSLLQKWAADSLGSGREIYRLYVISNIGSFVGLLAYPLLIEPFVSQFWQWIGFALGIALYLILCIIALTRSKALCNGCVAKDVIEVEPQCDTVENKVITILLWLVLPALSTAILNATTTHLSTDVSPFPLMWALLLAAFLLSYSIGFSKIGEKLLPIWAILAICSLCYAVSVLNGDDGSKGSFTANFIAGLAVILFCGNFLHAWLCRIRPAVISLTKYYLCISLGGAIGGFLSGVLPILISDSVIEYPIVLTATFVMVLFATISVLRPLCTRAIALIAPQMVVSKMRIGVIFTISTLAFILAICANSESKFEEIYQRGRNFYGCWTVARDIIVVKNDMIGSTTSPRYPVTILQNGNTTHGLEPEFEHFKNTPTAYYGELGGGLAFSLHPSYSATNQPLNVGIVGMGVGTQALYGRAGDTITFYEIDSDVVNIAKSNFSFIEASKADVKITIGDARKTLEKEELSSQPKFDILIIDAYSGDSVPFHLITKQAFDLYFSRLKEDGILALHISNWHIDLFPICKAVSKSYNINATGVLSPGAIFTWRSSWVFMSKQQLITPQAVQIVDWEDVKDMPLPNDEIGSLLPYIRFRH